MFSKRINAKLAVQILIDIPEDIQNLRVAVMRIDKFQPVFHCGAVQMYHEFQEQHLTEQFRRISIVRERFLELGNGAKQGTFF